jgi:hypothetical protein
MLTCSHSSFTLLLPVAAIRPLAFGGETHKSFGDCIPLSGRWALQMHVMPAGQSAADSLRRILTAPRCRATSFTHQSAIILDAAAARCTVRTWVIGGRFPFPERRGILEADLTGRRPAASLALAAGFYRNSDSSRPHKNETAAESPRRPLALASHIF